MSLSVLCVGNSFSQDATRYLEAMADSCGQELSVRNCCIGGCSLAQHLNNLLSEEALYEFQRNGESERMISLEDALAMQSWDIVTVQQVSYLAGQANSYGDTLEELIAAIRLISPGARIFLHEVWGYEAGCTHTEFARYGCDPGRMADDISSAVRASAERYALPVIPAGSAIRRAGTIPQFDPSRGGVSLYRDGFHLTCDYGRYLAGLVWFSSLTGRSAADVAFIPDGTEEALIHLLKKIAAD